MTAATARSAALKRAIAAMFLLCLQSNEGAIV